MFGDILLMINSLIALYLLCYVLRLQEERKILKQRLKQMERKE